MYRLALLAYIVSLLLDPQYLEKTVKHGIDKQMKLSV